MPLAEQQHADRLVIDVTPEGGITDAIVDDDEAGEAA